MSDMTLTASLEKAAEKPSLDAKAVLNTKSLPAPTPQETQRRLTLPPSGHLNS